MCDDRRGYLTYPLFCQKAGLARYSHLTRDAAAAVKAGAAMVAAIEKKGPALWRGGETASAG